MRSVSASRHMHALLRIRAAMLHRRIVYGIKLGARTLVFKWHDRRGRLGRGLGDLLETIGGKESQGAGSSFSELGE